MEKVTGGAKEAIQQNLGPAASAKMMVLKREETDTAEGRGGGAREKWKKSCALKRLGH